MKGKYIISLLAGIGIMLVIAATTVTPGRKISEYTRASEFQLEDIFVIARTNVSVPTNLGVTGYLVSNFVKGISAELDTVVSNGLIGVIEGLTNEPTSVPLTPGVTNLTSASTFVIDLALTNTPVWTLTNPAAHNISIVISNPAPGRWFSFYGAGSGVTTNNTLTWSAVSGTFMKWFDATTNSAVVSNGFVNVSGYIAMTAPSTNLVITYRDE